MENDPNKNDSKGKRLFKKALRRTSKSNNGSQGSDQGIGATRSKSLEDKNPAVEINDSASLPTPDGPADRPEHSQAPQKPIIRDKGKTLSIKQDGLSDGKSRIEKKFVDIQEERNEVHEEATGSKKEKSRSSLKLDNIKPDSGRRGTKRKFEEESVAGTSGASTGASDTDADDKDPGKDKKKKNRCAVCRKKVGLTGGGAGFECRCGGLFCAVHRYSDKHECSFDYRELGAQEIRRNNPVVVSQKIHKI